MDFWSNQEAGESHSGIQSDRSLQVYRIWGLGGPSDHGEICSSRQTFMNVTTPSFAKERNELIT
ncbi:hypothetical protein GJ744_008650 [Endocarpon pusillum]|uniref:Uncharacterized protein n=1 Tax=Endocarpon pusillum TaxID=364733 RepID=A0A8H7AGN1_9EURO|nr:hypothetical protein GJ744_008650 [Endocarpon pusillum]